MSVFNTTALILLVLVVVTPLVNGKCDSIKCGQTTKKVQKAADTVREGKEIDETIPNEVCKGPPAGFLMKVCTQDDSDPKLVCNGDDTATVTRTGDINAKADVTMDVYCPDGKRKDNNKNSNKKRRRRKKRKRRRRKKRRRRRKKKRKRMKLNDNTDDDSNDDSNDGRRKLNRKDKIQRGLWQ